MSDAAPVQTPLPVPGDGGIECRDVSHWFRDQSGRAVHALDRVSLTIGVHSFVSLLGPSGCGKTTLLRVIDGLVAPTQGAVVIGGHRVTGPGADRAMVFQEHNLLPWKTALENLTFGCKLVGIGRREGLRRAREAITLMGLTGFEDHLPNQLSGGMKQRVGIARALSIRPQTLLMDEPFGALDAQTREVMQSELLRIWESDRKTVAFVTHSIDEAILLSDRIVVMGTRPGRIKTVIDVDLPRPRDEEMRADSRWTILRKRLWQLLKPEIIVGT
jgi:NitT/TauT family transport system ATP-binding protein